MASCLRGPHAPAGAAPRGHRLPSWHTCPRLSFQADACPGPPCCSPSYCVPGAGCGVQSRVGELPWEGRRVGTGSPRCPSVRGTAPRCLGCLVCVWSDGVGTGLPREPSVPEAALQSCSPPTPPQWCCQPCVQGRVVTGCPCQLCVSLAVGLC